MELLESRGTNVTFDYQGNLIMVKNPKLRGQKNISYQVGLKGESGLNLQRIGMDEDDYLDEANFHGGLGMRGADSKSKSGQTVTAGGND